MSCVAIDNLTDATQLSPTIGNATDSVAAYSQSARSRSVELSCVRVAIDSTPTQLNSTRRRVKLVELCRYKRALSHYGGKVVAAFSGFKHIQDATDKYIHLLDRQCRHGMATSTTVRCSIRNTRCENVDTDWSPRSRGSRDDSA